MYKELDSARNSFAFVLKNYGIRKVFIPYYLCDVMRHSAYSSGCEISFYHIDDNFLPMTDFGKSDYVLYPNYFGICDENVKNLVKEYPNIIIDNAHSYYSKPSGFACFTSRKKFLNVTSGSDLWYENYDENRSFDEKVIKARQNRFNFMHEKYGKSNRLIIKEPYSPFVYPYLAESETDADKLVSELTKSGINIYRYWNELPKSYSEYKFYSRLVPVPVI